MRRATSRIVMAGALVLAVLAALALRVVVEGRDAIADGDTALAEQRPLDAIAAWERAARWYLPLAPHVDDAYARLVELAQRERGIDLVAWRAVRSAALASRSLWTPHADDLALANAEIARITAKDPEGSLAAGNDPAERLAWQQGRLDRDPRPQVAAIVLAIIGIVCWLGGLAWLVRRGLDAKGQADRRRLTQGLGIALAGVLAWIAGLYNA